MIFFWKKKNKQTEKLTKVIGFKPKKASLYKEAFTHTSEKKRKKNGSSLSFERLEFLGDAILDVIVSEYLYKESPYKDEGYLSKMRAKLVNRESLNRIGERLELTSFLTVTKKNRLSTHINGDLLEALIGAIYLDKGFKPAKKFVYRHLLPQSAELKALELKITSYKSLLIEWAQKNKKEIQFNTQEDFQKKKTSFHSAITLNGEIFSIGCSGSKKTAEELAAKEAYLLIQKNEQSI